MAAPLPPRIDPITLPELTALEVLDAHESYDGVRLSGLDLSGQDLTGVLLTESALENVSANETILRTAEFADVSISRLNAAVFLAARSRYRDVLIDGSRMGSAELYDASLTTVHLRGSKLGYLNLRGARLHDVLFEGCTIDEIDLTDATLTRVAFVDTTITTLNLLRSRLSNVDLRGATFGRVDDYSSLRGATLSAFQVSDLAESFAVHLGIAIAD